MKEKTSVVASRSNQREHFWDAIRAFLMLLGIPYHTAIAYRPGQDWIVHSGEGAQAFTWLAEFIHLFRMPAFFVVAGYFAALLLSRREAGAWLSGRFWKLGIPFLAAIVLLVPAMNLLCELSNLPLAEALASWRHESLTSAGYWIRHLWFIIVLLYCSAFAAFLVGRRPALRDKTLSPRSDRWIAANFVPCLLGLAVVMGLWQAVAIELFYKAGLATQIPQQLLRIDEVIAYAPWFLLGCLIERARYLREELLRFSPPVAVIALASTLLYLAFYEGLSPPAGRFAATIAAVTVSQVLIAAAKRLADRPSPLVREFVAASFVIYLFHMPIIVALVLLGEGVPLPVALKVPAVMALALALSWGAWRMVAASPLLLVLFNGERMPQRLRELPA